MKLSNLLSDIQIIKKVNYKEHDVTELAIKHSDVTKGSLFFAIKGNNNDGYNYIENAVNNNAVCIITEKEHPINCTQIIVSDVITALNEIAYKFYMMSQRKIKVIGVVGTDGKTTTAHLTYSILKTAGIKVGLISTTGIIYENKVIAPELTTPDIISLYSILTDMVACECEYAVMELSAHAIAQRRTGKLKFEYLIFTNLSHDHLDYFSSFNEYKNVKISVFNEKYTKNSIVNVDDEVGRIIAKNQSINTITYGLYNPSDVFAVDLLTNDNKLTFIMNLFDELISVKYFTVGDFNVYNCMAASIVAYSLGVDFASIKRGLNCVDTLKGRMEYLETFNGGKIYVDYAHTPNGLKNTLTSLKGNTKNHLIVLFGCGGGRDKEKRSIMGEIAGKYADFTVITTDNPRYEEQYLIIKEIEKGIRKITSNYITIQNRYIATGYAIQLLSEGDTLVLCGKGAECYQEIMGVKVPYSDAQTVREIIAQIDLCGEPI